jgi:hypothetical protein
MRDAPATLEELAPRPVIAADCDNSTLRARMSGQPTQNRSIEAELRAAAREREQRELAGTRDWR